MSSDRNPQQKGLVSCCRGSNPGIQIYVTYRGRDNSQIFQGGGEEDGVKTFKNPGLDLDGLQIRMLLIIEYQLEVFDDEKVLVNLFE